MFIGLLGPLGIGKSTVARVLINELKAKLIINEPFLENPFWKKSQKEPEFMLRSQMYFLLSNIINDWKAVKTDGIAISDTSCLTDILMWAWWYQKTGHLTKKEYQNYLKLVNLLKPIIPKPDLMILLVPDTIDNLKQGIIKRVKNEPYRQGELVFVKKDSQDLALQTKRVYQLKDILTKDWQIKVLFFQVNPLTVRKDKKIQEMIVEKVKKRLF